MGGYPIAKYLERRDALEKRWFIGAGLLLLALVVAVTSVLTR